MTKKQAIALVNKRCNLAKQLLSVSSKVDAYIIEHNLQDKVANEDWLLGVEMLGNPRASADEIIKVIEKEVVL